MHVSSIMLLVLAAGQTGMYALLMNAFYPALLLVFIIASLGIPIPEDIPLITAGVILRTQPGVATWTGTILVSLVGIMSGDLILYTLGRRWGPEVFNHRSVKWLITPYRLKIMTGRFHKYGIWACFFGRLFVGVRAVMCLTAGVTRFPYWKFFLADCAGALISIPVFVGLGYAFAGMIPTLRSYVSGISWILMVVAVLVIGGVVWYEWRKLRRPDPPLSGSEGSETGFITDRPTIADPPKRSSDVAEAGSPSEAPESPAMRQTVDPGALKPKSASLAE